jgi:hypothetical protein
MRTTSVMRPHVDNDVRKRLIANVVIDINDESNDDYWCEHLTQFLLVIHPLSIAETNIESND